MRNGGFEIGMPLFPAWPAFVIVFQVNNHKILFLHLPPDEFCLRPDMLYVEMPIVTFLQFLSHGLLGSISIRQSEKCNDGLSFFWKISRQVDRHSYAILHHKRIDTIMLLGQRQVAGKQVKDGG